jgi:hypothetical protein
MVKEDFNLLKWMATYDKRYAYLLLFILVLLPMIYPIGMPISVSELTKEYYEQLETLEEGDIVLDSWSTEYSGYMELKPGMISSHKYFIKNGIKLFICLGHPEGLALVQALLDEELKSYMEKYDYTYGEDYIILGTALPNQAATLAMATDFQANVKVDWKGNSITGTFLDRIETGADIDMISDYTTGAGNPGLINHIVLTYGTPMIQNQIGVSLPGSLANKDAGLITGLLASTRGGSELELLVNEPGPGLIAMDAFTLGHYLLIIFIVIGNIGYFGWAKRVAEERERTAIG